MKITTVYVAANGKRFDKEAECVKYEQDCAKVADIASLLKVKPDTCDFSNGGGFVQQHPLVVKKVRKKLIDLFHEVHPTNPWRDDAEKGIIYDRHLSHHHRYCDDLNSPLLPLLYRMACMDEDGREWGQPYYANNPSAGKQVEVTA